MRALVELASLALLTESIRRTLFLNIYEANASDLLKAFPQAAIAVAVRA